MTKEEEEETSADFLERIGTDGYKWAIEFNKMAQALGYSKMDQVWLMGWFEHAIEAGRREGQCFNLNNFTVGESDIEEPDLFI